MPLFKTVAGIITIGLVTFELRRFRLLCLCIVVAAPLAANGWDEDFQVATVAKSSPPRVTFTWSAAAAGPGTVNRRILGTYGWSTQTGTFNAGATSFVDSTLNGGVCYEYRRFYSDGAIFRFAYVAAGVDLPLIEQNGQILLARDPVGDGWQVLRREVPRDDGVYATRNRAAEIKTIIKHYCDAALIQRKAVLLFDRVPVPQAQSLSTPEGVPDGDPVTFIVVEQPTMGLLTCTPPHLTYRPCLNQYGADSFRFVASDGVGLSAPAMVAIEVAAVNDPPVAHGTAQLLDGNILFYNLSQILNNIAYDFLVSVWFRADDPGNNKCNQILFEAGRTSAINLYLRGGLFFFAAGTVPMSAAVESGRWHHIALTADSVVNTNLTLEPILITAYLDGQLIGRLPYSPFSRLDDTWLSAPTGGATLGAPSSAVLTVMNDDLAAPAGTLQFSAATYSIMEGDSGASTATITVTRSGGSAGVVGVSYATSDGTATAGSDYLSGIDSTLSWADGDTAAKTIAVTILGDTLVEPDETVNLTLFSPTGGAVLGEPIEAVLIIINDDVAIIPVDENVGGSVELSSNRSEGFGCGFGGMIGILFFGTLTFIGRLRFF